MPNQYALMDLIWYVMVYSLIGWTLEVCVYAVTSRRFVNRGLLNLPFSIPYGLTSAALMLVLPTLDGLPMQFFMTLAVYRLIRSLCDHVVRRVSGAERERSAVRRVRLLAAVFMAALLLVQYLLIHPFLLTLFSVLPGWARALMAWVFLMLITADYFCVRHTLRTHRLSPTVVRHLSGTQRLADRMTDTIWRRLQRAYPGIRETGGQEHTFAKGLCFDKLFWIFLVSSVLGALIEMVFCRVTGGVWMNRSSLLYGPFSVVWGLGAVVLTVALQGLSERPDRYVFLGGCVLGGVYEYLCSVFTEAVFGTVFWDYSHMPLNLGGRINLLYCIFWGLLAVLWLRVLHPPMEQCIEALPPLAGKVITWVLIVLMLCNAALTSAAMLRCTERRSGSPRSGIVAQFLDERYPDSYMEHRWPNMIIINEKMADPESDRPFASAQNDTQMGIASLRLPEGVQQGLTIATQLTDHRVGIPENQLCIRREIGEHIIQRIQIPSVVFRQLQTLSELRVDRGPVGHGFSVQQDCHGHSSP